MTDVLTKISSGDYRRVCELAYETAGIVLGEGKEEMLRARLTRRVVDLGLGSISDYVQLLGSARRGEELANFVNAITTNKTEFFREKHHFDYLANVWAPGIVREIRTRSSSVVRIWSAACSIGAEPYTLAMVLRESLGTVLNQIEVKILATDIDTSVLAQAKSGTYTMAQLRPIPSDLLRKWFLKGVGSKEGFARAHPALRDMITFQQLNFMDSSWPIRSKLDVVFCRNVLIYFDYDTQGMLIRRFHAMIEDGGMLFLGHSESTQDDDKMFQRLGRTIYRKMPST